MIPRVLTADSDRQGCEGMNYVLASMSPRRRELLSDMGLVFDVCPADIDENIGIDDPKLLVSELAFLKAGHVVKRYAGDEVLVIAADTVVALDNTVLGKPADEEDAFRMLSSLSGRKHTVYTGYCCANAKNGHMAARCAAADVWFRRLSEQEIWDYIKTGEPMDKAGAYGIQGGAAAFVETLSGELSCVIGLPTKALFTMLHDEFHLEGR